MILITTHIGADFDAAASLLAASKIYPEAKVFLPGSPEKKVRQYINEKEFPLQFSSFDNLKDLRFDRAVIVDTGSLGRIGRAAKLISQETKIIIYDHHPRPEERGMEEKGEKEMGGEVNGKTKIFSDTHKLWGATVTILLEEIRKKDIELTPEEASVLITGIYEDTGCLTYPITTHYDIDAVSWLLEQGADLNTVSKYAVHNLNEQQVHLLGRLLNNKSFLTVDRKKIAITYDILKDYVEELAVVVRKFMDTVSPDALFAILKIKENILCIARSVSEDINVADIISGLGGAGGHRSAATVSFKEDRVSIDELKIKIRESVYKKLREEISKKDRPDKKNISKIIPRDDTVRRAYHTLNHLNLKYAPVGGEEGFIDGLVLRGELKKAVKHGMGGHKVSEFLTEKVSFDPATEQPYVEDRFPEYTINPVYKAMKDKFNSNLSAETLDLIRTAAKTASMMGIEAYCVGGIIRDMLLDIKHTDIDIIVKKNAVEFSGKLAEVLGGSYYTHNKFHTAVVKTSGREIDIATLRKEYYEVPAALPNVQKGTLRQDLARRDFTINAMAVQISPQEEYGNLIDYFGGLEDIKNRTIRILYPLSFIEDPTRIFRAVRFEKRFNFKMTGTTLRQLKKTVNMDIEEELTPDRIKEEIFKILSEDNAGEIIRRLNDLGGLKCIDRNLQVSDGALNIIKNFDRRTKFLSGELFEKLTVEFKEKLKENKPDILLLSLICGLSLGQGERMLKIFNFSNLIKDAFRDLKLYETRILALLSVKLTDARIFKAVNKISELALDYILITAESSRVKKNILGYLKDIKEVRPALSGANLIEMGFNPSRRFSRMLYALRIAKINGVVEDYKSEKDFIRKHF